MVRRHGPVALDETTVEVRGVAPAVDVELGGHPQPGRVAVMLVGLFEVQLPGQGPAAAGGVDDPPGRGVRAFFIGLHGHRVRRAVTTEVDGGDATTADVDTRCQTTGVQL